MFAAFLAIIIFIIAFTIRLLPILKVPRQGSDAYYFLFCTETLKQQRKIPITLPPYYLLELEEQWYPPGFTLFLSLFPARFLHQYYWLLSPFVDSINCVITFSLTYQLTSHTSTSFVAGIIYALSLSTIRETIALTSRQLGSLFFMLTVLFGILYVSNSHISYLTGFFLFGFALLMTHKLSSQAFYVLMPVLSIIALNISYAALLIALLIVVYILSGGFFLKVLRAHYEIVWFWNRHWGNLGMHQIYDSPIYGRNKETAGISLNAKYHQSGFRYQLKQILRLLSINPFLIAAISVLLGGWFINHNINIPYYNEFIIWILVVTVFGLLTIWVPILRSFGEGHKYNKLTAFPIAYIASCPLTMPLSSNLQQLYVGLLILLLALAVVSYLRFVQRFSHNTNTLSNIVLREHDQLFDYVKRLPQCRLICLPTHLCDLIVYHCRVPVLWGTHGYPFSTVESFFPILQKPLTYFQKKYQLTHLVLDTKYANPGIFSLTQYSYQKFGTIHVYAITEDKK